MAIRRMVMVLLAQAGVFLSLYLTLFKLGYIGHLACAVGSCERVQASRWSTLFGLPVAGWGVAFYVVTFTIALLGVQQRFWESRRISWLLVACTGWGVLFSAYLTWLELFAIHGICLYCVTSAALVVVLFALSVSDLLLSRPSDGSDERVAATR